MIRIQRLIINGNNQGLFKSQYRGMCQKKQPFDLIGPANPVSNLRPIKYAVRENESYAEKELRQYREELQLWNEQFWLKHNLNFIKKKKEFQEIELKKKGTNDQLMNADEISVFYKDFLDKNWKVHCKYLIEWYKRNAFATFLHFKVIISKIFKKKS